MAFTENVGRVKYGQGIFLDLSYLSPELLSSLPYFSPLIHAPGAKILNLEDLELQQRKKYSLVSPLGYPLVKDKAMMVIIPKSAVIQVAITAPDISHAQRLIIFAEEGSRADITEIAQVGEYKSQIVQIYVGNGAEVRYSSLQQGGSGSHLFSLKRGEVSENGSLEWRDYVAGGKLMQVQLQTKLLGRGSRTKKITLFSGKEQNKIDLFAEAIHSAPESVSVMYGRGIVDQAARAIYRGNIKVEKHAAQCKGEQRADALLLGDEARCDAIPMLEVENDSVQCSHGMAIGRINSEQLFYLTSRGLPENEAQELLLQGFFEPLLLEFPPEIREKIKISTTASGGVS